MLPEPARSWRSGRIRVLAPFTLYHQFKDKEDLALAVIDWVDETWRQEVGRLIEQEPDPVVALIVLARGHAVYCRRDVARVAMALRLEFSGQDHPVGRHLERVSESLVKRCARLISAGAERERSQPVRPPEPSRSPWSVPWRARSSNSLEKRRTMRCWRRARSPACLDWASYRPQPKKR